MTYALYDIRVQAIECMLDAEQPAVYYPVKTAGESCERVTFPVEVTKVEDMSKTTAQG